MSVGKWGQAYLNSLKENRPQLFATLQAKGELQRTVAEVQERAQAQFETLLSSLRAENPPPKDPASRVSTLAGLEQQATELVLSELLVKDEETEAAERDGYVDQEPPPLNPGRLYPPSLMPKQSRN